METELGNPLLCPGILGLNSVMAGDASLVFIGGWGQRFFRFVAGATLLANGSFRIKFSCLVLTKPQLIMGVVAIQTGFMSFAIFDPFGTMDALIQVLHDLIVTVQTGIQIEKVLQVFVHLCWIWVETPGNVRMTVLAGILTMD
jgi:hypothetical protein